MKHYMRTTGFTLVEMVVVIVITGIIAGMVAVFMRMPVQQYADVARRAEMTDVADTALRRITRDVRAALPNSVRVSGVCDGTDVCTLEFMPTASGGRYRAYAGGPGQDELDFSSADASFDVLTAGVPLQVVPGTHQIVVYNLGIAGADAYAGNTLAAHNRRAVSGASATGLTLVSANPLPFASPSHRFHVVASPVSYVCNPALGTLVRRSAYGWPEAPAAGVDHLIASNVNSCSFAYAANSVAQRYGLVTMTLGIHDGNETVTLYNATHVSNQP